MSTLGQPMEKWDWQSIEAEAKRELADEDRKAHVAKAKTRIKEWRARPWWKRLLPFFVTIRFHWNWSN